MEEYSASYSRVILTLSCRLCYQRWYHSPNLLKYYHNYDLLWSKPEASSSRPIHERGEDFDAASC